MRFKHSTLIILSGMLWMGIGFFLLSKGLHYIIDTAHLNEGPSQLMHKLSSTLGSREQAALIMITCALAIGFIKGRFVLVKSVKRVVGRILSFPAPVKLSQIHSWHYYVLIGSMVLLGITIKWLPLSLDIRGLIDVAIGSALMNGGLLYFRMAQKVVKEKTTETR